MNSNKPISVVDENFNRQPVLQKDKYVCAYCGKEFYPVVVSIGEPPQFSRRYTDKAKMARIIENKAPHYIQTAEFKNKKHKGITLRCCSWSCCAKIMNSNEDVLSLMGGDVDRRRKIDYTIKEKIQKSNKI